MNFANFERARAAEFAYRQARRTGSLDCIKALLYGLRNRVAAGWGNGTWLAIIEAHPEVEGSIFDSWAELDPNDRLLQMTVRDIDDIYTGISSDDTRRVVNDSLYWQFIDRPPRPWFVEHIIQDPVNHPRVAQVGPIAFFK